MAASSLLTPFHSAEPLSSADFLAALKASPAGAKEIDAQTGNTPLHFAACGAAPLPVVSALLAAHKKAAGVLDNAGVNVLGSRSVRRKNMKLMIMCPVIHKSRS